MTDRDRLIELLHKAEDICDSTLDCDTCKYVLSGSCKTVLIADYLLANGVIVPIRCKDCEYYTPIKQQSTKWKSKTFYCTRNVNMKMNENDFCSCAKLKEREGK